MDEQRREFTGVWIPRHIFEDAGLTATERMLYAEINSFDKCFMSNATFSLRLGCSERTVSRLVQNLIDKRYIKVVSFDGRKRVLKAILDKPSDEADTANCVDRLDNMSMQGSQNVYLDNNIDTITKVIDTYRKGNEEKEVQTSLVLGDIPSYTNKPSTRKSVEYGNADVNTIISELSELMPTKQLDGTIKQNRNAAYQLYKKYGTEAVIKAIRNIKGSFYEGKITTTRALSLHVNALLLLQKKPTKKSMLEEYTKL